MLAIRVMEEASANDAESVINGIFATNVEKNQLREAILECTRDEVRKALFELLGEKQCSPGSSAARPSIAKRRATISKHPKAVVQKNCKPSSASEIEPTRVSQQKVPSRSSPSQTRLSLETGQLKSTNRLQRSTSVILEKSADIITKATGRRPTKCSQYDDDETDTKDRSNQPLSVKSQDKVAAVQEGIHRVESWPVPSRSKSQVHFRPVETTRLLRTSPHSVANVNTQRPSTTALERRSWTSTVASERKNAIEIGHKLLGPMALETKVPNHSNLLPNCLQINEWEHELARNIISVYSNKVRSDIKQCNEEDDYIPPATAIPNNVNNRLSSPGAFFQEDDDCDVEGDFQRISISRGGRSFSCFDVCDDTVMERPDTVLSPDTTSAVQRNKRKGRMSNGALRLRMIWVTGAGSVGNWRVDGMS